MYEEVKVIMAKKYKRLTLEEKKMRKEMRTELREKGILPPAKPRLNRKKFLDEVYDEYDREIEKLTDYLYLEKAINIMVGRSLVGKVTPEQVGVLKTMKLAVAIKQFEQEKLKDGKIEYTLGELYEKVIEPITSL